MIKHQAILENLHLFLEYAIQFAKDSGINDVNLSRIELAIEETIVNIINYSSTKNTTEIEMNCELRNSAVIIEVADNGTPFNPLEKEDPDISIPIEDREIGGLGIFLIKNIMDDVHYKRTDDHNILTLEKNI